MGKNDPQKREKSEEMYSIEVHSFDGWRLLLSTGRPMWRLGDKCTAIFYFYK
jgi:hypothetical protein